MELKFQKSPLKFLHRAVQEVQNQEQTLEVKLPDGMPDIGRVLASWGQVILRSKEWRSGSIGCNGGIMVWVLYAPEDGTDARCVESWLPFQMNWDLTGESREGNICIRPLLRFVDARSVSARKLMIRSGVAAMGQAFVEDQVEVGVPGELDGDIQLLRAAYPIRLLKEAGEKTFLLDEDLSLPPSSPAPEKIIYYCVQPEITERKVSGNRVVFRGNGNLHVLYRSDEGQLHTWDFELPFSQLGDLSQVYDGDAQPEIAMAVTSLELNLDDEGHMRLKCGLLGQFMVSDRQMLELVEDAYSPSRKVTPQFEELELPAILDSRRENIFGEQSIPQDADIIVDTTFLPDFPRQRRWEDRVEFELPGQFQVLFYGEDGRLQSGTARWEGRTQVNAGEDTQVDGIVVPNGLPQATMSNGSITMKGDAALQMESISRQGLPMVNGLEMEPAQEPDGTRPSVILRRAGKDRLWDIAKSTGSTMTAIRSANGFEGEPNGDQMLLIPVS